MNSNFGNYVILDDGIDQAVWANDYRYNNIDSAIKAAKKKAWKDHRDYYIAELVSGVELEPTDSVTNITTYLTSSATPVLEDKKKDV